MIVEIGIGAILFLVGYLIGRINLLHRLFQKQDAEYLRKPQDSNGWIINRSNKSTKVVDIDDSKFVTNISTDSFKSKHKELGKRTVSKDTVGDSVSKLKQLKGDKI